MSLPIRGFFFLVFLFVGLLLPSSVLAQTPSASGSGELESCFAYYQYGKVMVNLTSMQSSYSPGETADVRGTIVNTNTFPLHNVMLYAHIRRLNTTSTFAEGGHYLIERLPLLKDLNFLPGETKSVATQISLKKTFPAGSYKIEYFILSDNGFHYAGRPFLEEDIAGSSQFDIRNAEDPLLFFDVSALEVNGETHHYREPIVAYETESLSIRIPIIDRRETKTDVPVTLSYYAFEDTLESYRVATKQVVLSRGKTAVTDTFSPPYPGAFVVVASITQPFASEVKYRFAKKGSLSHELRINDMGVTDFPVSGSARAYVCIHSPARESTPESTVLLQVLDSSKKVVEEKKYTARFTGALQAMSVPLLHLSALDDFWVKTTVSWKNGSDVMQKEVLSHYDCSLFQGSTVKIDASYDGKKRLFSVKPVGICSQALTQNSIIESIRIVSDDGRIMKELYNQQIPADVSLTDLPAGQYTGEWKNGTQKQVIHIAIAGTFAGALITKQSVLLLVSIISFIILLLLWRKYQGYRARL